MPLRSEFLRFSADALYLNYSSQGLLFPMPRILRTALPIAACAALIAGCGSDVPTNGVAKIGDTVITKDQFNHWLNAAAHGSAQPGSPVTLPDPPNFTKCVANLA